jgi:ribosomal-protein-alanine N-acetyltransferase
MVKQFLAQWSYRLLGRSKGLMMRPMVLEDIPTVYALEQLCYEFPWSEKLLQDCVLVGYPCRVLLFDTLIIGYCIYRVAESEGHVFNIAVAPDCQSKGYGRSFLTGLIDEMKQADAKKILLEVRQSNLPARHLYESLGFVAYGTRQGYYPAIGNQREDAVLLSLDCNTLPSGTMR